MLDIALTIFKIDYILFIAMIPAIILGIYIYKRDIVEKEPVSLLIKLLFFGVLATGVSLFFENIFQNLFLKNVGSYDLFATFIKSFLIIGFTEEFIKWLFVYVLTWKNKNFDYVYDAIVYSSFVSIGFAAIENLLVIILNNASIAVAIKRGLISVPAHVFFAILAGYYLGKAKKYENRNWKKKSRQSIILSIILPIMVHGLFDFILFVGNELCFILLLVLIVYLYISSYYKVKETSGDKHKIKKVKY